MRDQDTKPNFIAWYRDVFGFSLSVATAMYEVQQLNDAKTFNELDDDLIDNIFSALRKDKTHNGIAELAVSRIKLLAFWVRHQFRTNRMIGTSSTPLVRVTLEKINLLKEQKRLEDSWRSDNKEPAYDPLTLDHTTAVKAFDKVKTLLTRVRGVQGVPLSYVIRYNIWDPEADNEQDSPFGDEDSKYSSIDEEMIARAPILADNAEFLTDLETLETEGPWAPTFPPDNKKVWSILHSLFSTSPSWQHVKKWAASQDGRQTYRTLHTHHFGRDRVDTMFHSILTTLQNLHYAEDRKNYNFDKYCIAHVEQHNLHAGLVEFGISELQDKMKILYFEEGIKDPSFASVKSTILANRAAFQDFDTVMELYVNTYRANKKNSEVTNQTRKISALQGRGDWGRGGGGGRGRGYGRGDPDKRKRNLVPQDEIDKVTNVHGGWYSAEEYSKFTPAMKAKHWQLKTKASQAPGTGPTSAAKAHKTIKELTTSLTEARSVISELTNATSNLTKKMDIDLPNPPNDEVIWGRNRDNPALARQDGPPKKIRPN